MEAIKANIRYTYADYLKWDDGVRYELLDGVPYMMAGPSQTHQEISVELARQLANFLRGKPCKVFTAPFDVRLNADSQDDTVVQPDLLVVCDRAKLDGKSCKGAPDLIVEIVSPSSSRLDRVLKFNKYLEAGVREYWIVDAGSQSVSAFVLEGGNYIARVYGESETVPVRMLEDCVIELREVFVT